MNSYQDQLQFCKIYIKFINHEPSLFIYMNCTVPAVLVSQICWGILTYQADSETFYQTWIPQSSAC